MRTSCQGESRTNRLSKGRNSSPKPRVKNQGFNILSLASPYLAISSAAVFSIRGTHCTHDHVDVILRADARNLLAEEVKGRYSRAVVNDVNDVLVVHRNVQAAPWELPPKPP